MRNLTKTLAVVSLLAPASAQPLGIGDLKLHSALNQKLNAEIDLLLTAGESASDINVRMAPPEKFDEAGVPWNYALSKIKFDTIVKPNGAVVVKLSTNEALQEPFLDFLVEVTWTKGNLYREFTVLVDPPVAYEQTVVPVVEEAETVEPAPIDTPEPAAIQQPEVAEPAQEAVEPIFKPEPIPATSTITSTPQAKPDSYGPTNRSDTLWNIAEKVKPSANVSTEQMMMALYEANPKAFYKDNVNALMSGVTLKVPDDEAIVKLSRQQAAKLFKEQVDEWNAPVKQAETKQAAVEQESAQAIEQVEALEEEALNTQLELEAPVETTVEDSVEVSPEQEQTAPDQVSEEGSVEETVAETEQAGEEQIVPIEDSATKELRQRLEQMESQLSMMQKLLTIKEEELAALKNKQALEQQQAVAKPATETAPKESVGDTAQAQKPAAVPQQPKPIPRPVQPPVESEEGLFGDSYYSIAGGLAVLLLGGLGWLWWRQRNQEDYGEGDESLFTVSSEIRMPDSEDGSGMVSDTSKDSGSSYDVGTVGESSFLSEFTPSDFDAFDSDMNEVDPISEADVYLAYGRYQQAEELMRQAIADEPSRDDCKLKLLEIFYANENQEAFEDYVRELAESGKRKDESFWAKVLEMGNEIIPNSNVLTADVVEENVAEEAEETTADEETNKEGVATFDITSFDEDESSEDKKELAGDEPDDVDSLDFDLSSFEDAVSDLEEEESQTSESLDFDLDSFGADLDEDEAEDLAEQEIETLDFNLDEKTPEQDELATELSLDETEEVGEELESFDFSTIEESMEKSGQQKLDDAEDEEFSFDLALDEASSTSSDELEFDLDEGVSDLTDMDEIETKIDLAKAYIDMGDEEAAKSIVEEVLQKGNDQQKETARSLMEQLS